MTASRAERIVGFPFESVLNPAKQPLPNGTRPMRPVWLVTGNHNLYGYSIATFHEKQEEALRLFVDANYREISQIVCREQGHRCIGCGFPMVGKLEIDHILMRSHIRVDTRDNLRALCTSKSRGGNDCHYLRHNKPGWSPQFTLEELSRAGQEKKTPILTQPQDEVRI